MLIVGASSVTIENQHVGGVLCRCEGNEKWTGISTGTRYGIFIESSALLCTWIGLGFNDEKAGSAILVLVCENVSIPQSLQPVWSHKFHADRNEPGNRKPDASKS